MIRGYAPRSNLFAIRQLILNTVQEPLNRANRLQANGNLPKALDAHVDIYALDSMAGTAHALLYDSDKDSTLSRIGLLAVRSHMAKNAIEKTMLDIRLNKGLDAAASAIGDREFEGLGNIDPLFR